MLLRFQKAAGRGNYEAGNQAFSKCLRFVTIRVVELPAQLQQTTESFLATHNSVVPARPSIWQWEQQPVLLALVIALLVVMGHVLLQGSAQRDRKSVVSG